jgi:hypothetical protein
MPHRPQPTEPKYLLTTFSHFTRYPVKEDYPDIRRSRARILAALMALLGLLGLLSMLFHV